MNERRFFNPHQPQTLQIAVLLLYISAFFSLLALSGLTLLLGIGMAAGAYGIANEQRWGYSLAVAAALLRLFLFVAVVGTSIVGEPLIGLSLLIYGALVALLLHPQSREYQRIWFR